MKNVYNNIFSFYERISECKIYKIAQNMKLFEEKFPDIPNEII